MNIDETTISLADPMELKKNLCILLIWNFVTQIKLHVYYIIPKRTI